MGVVRNLNVNGTVKLKIKYPYCSVNIKYPLEPEGLIDISVLHSF
jgi:hypothetical protein